MLVNTDNSVLNKTVKRVDEKKDHAQREKMWQEGMSCCFGFQAGLPLLSNPSALISVYPFIGNTVIPTSSHATITRSLFIYFLADRLFSLMVFI